MRRQFSYVVGIIVVAIAGIVYTFVAGNEPLLGIDLQGGVSVVLQPKLEEGDPAPSDDVLEQAVEVIRNRVDGLGVREPEIIREGSTVLVQLPGVENQEKAIELVGQTAELRFRPVVETMGLDGLAVYQAALDIIQEAADPANEVDEETLGFARAEVNRWELTPDASASEEAVLESTDSTSPDVRLRLGPAPELAEQPEGLGPDDPPARVTGEIVSGAIANFSVGQGWFVSVDLRGGSPGADDFNNLAGVCFVRDATVCPSGRIAIEIDGFVESAPSVQSPDLGRTVQITGNFSESEAKDLALVLRFGSLPLSFEAEDVNPISSTLGEDALDAGLAAGLIGFALVSLYLIAYYRLLGIVAIVSLAISGAMLWTMVAWLGESQGLALTLAGVTGLIVSVGVSVDSNVVYFEHLKEDVRGGRTVRSAVERAFPIAYSTIVKADVASLIAAVVLYFLTVGQVKGFALFLGLATVLDLVATYFFMGPVVRLMARRDGMTDHPRRYGIPIGEVVT
jgi:preprotein translocase subunit SecD